MFGKATSVNMLFLKALPSISTILDGRDIFSNLLFAKAPDPMVSTPKGRVTFDKELLLNATDSITARLLGSIKLVIPFESKAP